MNEDVGAQTLERVEKTGWGIVKWTIYIIVGISILGGIFWALLYSTQLANFSSITSLRNWYQGTYWRVRSLVQQKSKTYPPFDPIYTIRAKEERVGSTIYEFNGTFSSLDSRTNIVFLKGYDGKIYAFSFDPEIFRFHNSFLNIENITATPSGGIAIAGTSDDLGYDTDVPITQKSAFVIQWDDSRTLSQIQSIHDKSPNSALNVNSTQIFFMSKIN